VNQSDLNRLVEISETSESVMHELDAMKGDLFDLGNRIDDIRRRCICLVETLVELHGEPVPAVVEFEEVDR
jgi:hypothetical protein